MELVKLFRNESAQTFKLVVLLMIVSGAANGALVGLLNAGAMAAHSSTIATRDFLLFVVGLALYLYAKDISENRGKKVMELAMSKQRLRIYQKIENANLATIETLNPSEVIAKTSRNINQILQSSDSVIYGMQSLTMLVFCSIYLCIISLAAFLVVMFGVGGLILLRYLRDSTRKQQLEEQIVKEGVQSRYLADMIEGFKEIKINHGKARGLFGAFDSAVQEARELSVTDWVSAQQRALRARRSYLDTLVAYRRALLEFEAATGKPIATFAPVEPVSSPSPPTPDRNIP